MRLYWSSMVWNLHWAITISISSVATAFNKTDCHRLIPTDGVWIDKPNCKFEQNLQIFNEEDTARCMDGRTLYVIGNSVPRQFAFGLIEMLGGGRVKREGQRDECPKHETFWGDSCHKTFKNVNIRYLFLQFLDGYNYTDRGGFPFLRDEAIIDFPPTPNDAHKDLLWADDNCISHNVLSCFETFFNGSKSTDVLMFSAGMPFVEAINSPIIDGEAWLRSSAASFRAHISSTFHGKVFRVTNSQTRGRVVAMTPVLQKIDNMLWGLWRPGSQNDQSQWHTIDQWSINKGRDHLYNDHIHWVGPLTIATLHQMLNIICPGGGMDSPASDWPSPHRRAMFVRAESRVSSNLQPSVGASVSTTSGEASERYLQHYYVPDDGMLYRLGGNQSCLESLPHTTIKPLSDDDFALMRLAPEIVPDICVDGTLIRSSQGREVYMMLSDRKRSFPNGDIFASMGLSFENVVVVSDWFVQTIPDGPSF